LAEVSTKQLVVYEVNLRAMGPGPGFSATTKRLPAIHDLGVNTIWLMPIQPVGKVRSAGGLGSPYATQEYDEVNPEFGTGADFKELVDEAHSLGMRVLIDWVADHTSWDSSWLKSHPEWYMRDARGNVQIPKGTNWQDAAALDYGQPGLRKAMIQAMLYWPETYGIDGFRCDSADRQPADFWAEAIQTIRSQSSRPLTMLAEGYRSEDYSSGFDLTYGWHFYDAIKHVFQGQSAKILAKTNLEENQDVPEGKARLRFITNHDESAWNGSLPEFYGDATGERAAFALAALYGGAPLIYTGQEASWPNRIPFFDDSTIDWNHDPEAAKWIGELLKIRAGHRALQTGAVTDHSTDDVAMFTRKSDDDEVLVVVNVRGTPTELPPAPAGQWHAILGGKSVQLAPHETRVYVR
jgi:glycosidase